MNVPLNVKETLLNETWHITKKQFHLYTKEQRNRFHPTELQPKKKNQLRSDQIKNSTSHPGLKN